MGKEKELIESGVTSVKFLSPAVYLNELNEAKSVATVAIVETQCNCYWYGNT